jgi:hypothetical protein
MIDGFDHVHLIYGDTEAAGKFIETIFEGKIFLRGEIAGISVIRMDLYSVNFFIFGSKPGRGQFEPRKDLRGLDCIGFKVKDPRQSDCRSEGNGRAVQRRASTTPAGVKYAFIW